MRTATILNTGTATTLKGTVIQRVFALLFVLLAPVQASAGGHHNFGNVTVDIVSDQRGLLQQFQAGSQRMDTKRRFIIARNDERYRIRISNPSNERIGVVIAVDGRNIISGKKSQLRSNERMYIINPYQSQVYDGWRSGRNRINRFYFTGMNDSYAAHWGDHTAMGVVAVAVFNERSKQIHKERQRRNDSVSKKRNEGFDKFQSQREAPGTGFGEGKWSPSRKVRFASQKRPSHKIFIKYEWRKTLCRMGVIQCRPRHARGGQRHNRFWPFDSSHNNNNEGFAPVPFSFSPPKFK